MFFLVSVCRVLCRILQFYAPHIKQLKTFIKGIAENGGWSGKNVCEYARVDELEKKENY